MMSESGQDVTSRMRVADGAELFENPPVFGIGHQAFAEDPPEGKRTGSRDAQGKKSG